MDGRRYRYDPSLASGQCVPPLATASTTSTTTVAMGSLQAWFVKRIYAHAPWGLIVRVRAREQTDNGGASHARISKHNAARV